jgi:uncharacterized protein
MSRTVANPTPITQGWWDATRDQRLVIQSCTTCGHRQHEPRTLCRACAGDDLGHLDAAGTGTVVSFTVIHRAPSPDVDAPYVVAIVELDEGVRLLTNLVDVDPVDVTCDMPVTVTWLALDDGRHLPQYRPA